MKKNLLLLLLCSIAFVSSAHAGNHYEVLDLEGNKLPINMHNGRLSTPPIYTEKKPDISFKPQPVMKLPTSMTPEFMVQMGFPTHNLMYMLFLEGEEAHKAEGRVVYFEYRNYIGWLQVAFCRVFDLPDDHSFDEGSNVPIESALQSIRGFKESTKTPYELVTDVHMDPSHHIMQKSQSGKEPGTKLTQAAYGLQYKNHLLFMLCRRLRLEVGQCFPNHAQFAPSLPATYGNFMLVERDECESNN